MTRKKENVEIKEDDRDIEPPFDQDVNEEEEEAVDSNNIVVDNNKPPELMDISDIKGVGTTTVEKLKEMGIDNITDLAIASAIEIHEKLASTKHGIDFCQQLVIYANKYLQESAIFDKAIVSSKKLLDDDTVRKRFSTGDEMIDKWLGGGIESKAVTELYGRFKSGKSQLCYSTAVGTAASGKKVLFIDTENTYSPTRINEIASHRKLDVDKVHENILVMKPKAASILYLYLKELTRHIKEYNIELVIVDSIIALHRAEFIGRSNLSNRQQQLSRIMSYLVRNAENYDVGVMITNQVLESPDPFKPGQFATGGNIISHASTHRIYLKTRASSLQNKNKSYSIATMEDSPRYAKTELMIELGPYGVRGVDPSKPLPKD